MNSVAKLSVHDFVGIFTSYQNGLFAKMDVFEAVVVQHYQTTHHSFHQTDQFILLETSPRSKSLLKDCLQAARHIFKIDKQLKTFPANLTLLSTLHIPDSQQILSYLFSAQNLPLPEFLEQSRIISFAGNVYLFY